jgi:hypothetical protein
VHRSVVAVLIAVFAAGLAGCRVPDASRQPAIEFTTVPDAADGGSDRLEPIGGRVSGARPGQRLVLFARSGVWWVQPLVAEPFTSIGPDSTWRTKTHLGLEYGVLLVEPAYQPPATIDALPAPGGAVVAVATVKGRAVGTAAAKTLQFGGYEWEVRQTVSERGGTLNRYSPANAWTDDEGRLHLKIDRAPEGAANGASPWTCAEVTLKRSLGYGTYVLVVRDTSHLEPSAVFSFITWDPSGADPSHREMGIELTRWGDSASKNAQFVVQPYYVPANVARFMAPEGVLSHSLRWEPGRAFFKTLAGAAPAPSARPVSEHEFTSGVPAPGGETVRLSLYVFGYGQTQFQLARGTEVIVEKFVYLP